MASASPAGAKFEIGHVLFIDSAARCQAMHICIALLLAVSFVDFFNRRPVASVNAQ